MFCAYPCGPGLLPTYTVRALPSVDPKNGREIAENGQKSNVLNAGRLRKMLKLFALLRSFAAVVTLGRPTPPPIEGRDHQEKG